jgi:hypothetical protein
MNNALIRTSNDSKRTKIRLIVAGGSYMNSPIAPNGQVYTQLRCCAETGQPQLPRHMARMLPDLPLFLGTSLKL